MRKKGRNTRLVRQGGTKWEEWDCSQVSAPIRVSEDSPLKGGKDSVLAIPARYVLAVPLWVNATEPNIVQETVALELELRGLVSKKHSRAAMTSRTVPEGSRTLVLVEIFPSNLPAPLADEGFERYEASPLLHDFESNSATLWSEGPDLVVAFTRENQVVHWATSDKKEVRSARQWVESLALYLNASGVIKKSPERILWDDSIESRDDLLAAGYGQESAAKDSAVTLIPSLSHAAFSWKPEAVHHSEEKGRSSRRWRKILGFGGAAYLLMAIATAGYFWSLRVKENRLKREISELEEQVSAFEPVIRQWRVVGPSVDQATYPLEILHFVVKNLPKDGIRLTTFDVTDGAVVVEGEATSVSVATEFFGVVSKDPDLAGFRWEMPPPVLTPSNAARFHFNGVSR